MPVKPAEAASRNVPPLKARVASLPSAKPFRFGFLVHDVSRMRRSFFDLAMKPLGITRSQWSVLAALSRAPHESVMQVDLARRMDMGKVTIGGLLQRLENTGYVRRESDSRDGRVKQVFITAAGFEVIRKMQTMGEANNKIILDGVTPEELRVTERTLARVKANIRAELERLGAASGAKPRKAAD